jgi:hypothetical protein
MSASNKITAIKGSVSRTDSFTTQQIHIMKKQILSIVLACAGAIVFAGCATTSAPKPASSSATAENGWEKVIVTRNADDVKGMTRVDEVSASARKFFGDPDSLRKTATIKIKQEAAKIGASVVLIQTDDFAATPINNVNLVGVAYK